jgi:hypothetical protein
VTTNPTTEPRFGVGGGNRTIVFTFDRFGEQRDGNGNCRLGYRWTADIQRQRDDGAVIGNGECRLREPGRE